MTTIKEREARSALQISRGLDRGQMRLPVARPRRAAVRRSGQTPEARARFVKRVRSYLDVPRG